MHCLSMRLLLPTKGAVCCAVKRRLRSPLEGMVSTWSGPSEHEPIYRDSLTAAVASRVRLLKMQNAA